MRRFALVFCCLLFSATAQAQVVAPKMQRVKYSGKAGTAFCSDTGACKVLDGVAANASAALRTFVLKTYGYSVVGVQVNYTRSSGTALVLTCTGSRDGGVTYGEIDSVNISAGVGTMSPFYLTKTTSTTGNYNFDGLDVRRFDYVSCILAVTSGGTSDLADVYAIASVGQ